MHSVLVALMAAKAEVAFDPSVIPGGAAEGPARLARAVTDLGFPSEVIEGDGGAGEVEVTVRAHCWVDFTTRSTLVNGSL